MTAAGPSVLRAEPQLFTQDLGASLAFYEGVLGFRVVFVHGEPPFYAQVARGDARLNLRRVDGRTETRADEADLLAATLVVDGVEALSDEFRRAGAPIHQDLRTEPWGAQTFIVADPDGALLLFVGA